MKTINIIYDLLYRNKISYLFLNKCSLLATFVLLSFNLKSQPNLIYNGSFEIHDTCPYNSNQLEFSMGWINPTTGTPDYFHACATNPDYGVPYQVSGLYYQVPRSGSAYAHFGVYNNLNVREYVQTKLSDTLESGKYYYLKLYVNLTNTSIHCVKEMGTFFSSFQLTGSNYSPLSVIPQIETNYFLCDTLNWILITGFYLAVGNETYMTIGNFRDDVSTTSLYFDSTNIMDWATYYIDDVSLIEVLPNSLAGTDTSICNSFSVELGKPKTDSCTFSWSPSIGLDDPNKSNPIALPDTTTTYILTISGCGATVNDTVTVFVEPCIDASAPLVNLYPNPAFNELTIDYSSEEGFQLVFYDMIGRKVLEKEIEPGYYQKTEIDLMKLSAGIYNVFVIQNNKITKTEKIIVIK